MKGALIFHSILAVLDLFGCLLIISGFSAVFSSNTTPGGLIIVCGCAIALNVDICRALASLTGPHYPSEAARDLALAASSMQAFGSISTAVAQFIISDHGKKSYLWLAVTGSIIMFIGGLFHAVNAYMMQQMNRFEDTE